MCDSIVKSLAIGFLLLAILSSMAGSSSLLYFLVFLSHKPRKILNLGQFSCPPFLDLTPGQLISAGEK